MISIRIASENDLDAMCSVAVRNGLALKADEWRNIWRSNPYRQAFEDVPIGWILETDSGAPVGTLLNFHMMYDFDGKLVRGALGSGAAIDPPYRNKSLMLIGKFLRQKEADFCIVGSANPAVAQLCNVLARRIPTPDSDVPILWPADYQAFAAAVLKRKNVPGAGTLAIPAGVALRAVDIFRRKCGSTRIDVELSHAFDDRFDAFWERIRTGPRRLRAVRTRVNLEYRFQNELRNGSLRIMVARQGKDVSGYIVLLRVIRGEFGFGVHEIVDLQAPGDDAGLIGALITEALRLAKSEGSGMLKWRAWNAAKRAVALRLGPYSYQYPLWQAYYSVSNPELSSSLATPDVWDFSPFEIF